MPNKPPPYWPDRPRGFTRPPLHYRLETIDRMEAMLAGPGAPIAVGNIAIITAPGLLQGLGGEIVCVGDGSVRVKLHRGGELTVSAADVVVIAPG